MHLDALAAEDHTYVATRAERARHEGTWRINLHSQGSNTAPALSRADYTEAVAKLRVMKKEALAAGHKFNRVVGADRQIWLYADKFCAIDLNVTRAKYWSTNCVGRISDSSRSTVARLVEKQHCSGALLCLLCLRTRKLRISSNFRSSTGWRSIGKSCPSSCA